MGQVASEGLPVLTVNAVDDPRFANELSIVSGRLRSILCVPLRARDRVTGVIYAEHRSLTGVFEDHDLDLLAAFADQSALAIENARLFDKVKANLAAITEMKDLMDGVFASIASGVVTTDLKDNVQLMNRAAERIFGVARSDAIGRALADVVPGAGELAPLVQEALSGEAAVTRELSPSGGSRRLP